MESIFQRRHAQFAFVNNVFSTSELQCILSADRVWFRYGTKKPQLEEATNHFALSGKDIKLLLLMVTPHD